MSNAIRLSPLFQTLQPGTPFLYSSYGFLQILRQLSVSETRTASMIKASLISSRRNHEIRAEVSKESVWSVDDVPVSIELQPIVGEGQFNRIIAEAQQLEESVVVVWMASWCRKCIYLKPKLEKLAADYYPRIRFYCVDVNTIPHRLVSRAGVTKMPTIQIWKDCKKQAEVIGGHKAHLVVNEVHEIIENEGSL